MVCKPLRIHVSAANAHDLEYQYRHALYCCMRDVWEHGNGDKRSMRWQYLDKLRKSFHRISYKQEYEWTPRGAKPYRNKTKHNVISHKVN
jgi:hypothetical protein